MELPNEKSYIERRQLFKNIWEAAINIDEKDDVTIKPKVIKTLRLDEMDKYAIGKKKKQRIKSLRHVCKKILDFCDRQDADDVLFEQMGADGDEPGLTLLKLTTKSPKKTRIHRGKKKMKKAKSMFSPSKNLQTQPKEVVSERKDEVLVMETSKNDFPIPVINTVLAEPKAKVVKSKSIPRKHKVEESASLGDNKNVSVVGRKTVRKKRIIKRKKASDFNVEATGR